MIFAIASLDATPPQILGFFASEPLSMGTPEAMAADKPVGLLVSMDAARRLLGDHAQHGRPEERLADSVDNQRRHRSGNPDAATAP